MDNETDLSRFDPSRVRHFLRNRQSKRLAGYDYSQPGMYFITICVHNRVCRLGTIQDDETILNTTGQIVYDAWSWMESTFPMVTIDMFVVMPNHVHAIIHILSHEEILSNRRGDLPIAPIKPKTLGRLVGSYKTRTTILINEQLRTPGRKFWQRDYYDHIIRDESDLYSIQEYIQNNPLKWLLDGENPDRKPVSNGMITVGHIP